MNSASPDTTLLFVVGMHRSGTSALCAALQSCGATFGAALLDPMQGVNDEGFWEDSEVVEVNEKLLEHMGRTWFTVDPALSGAVNWSAPSLSKLRTDALAILERGFGVGPLQVVKDPRFCITLPFWLDLCVSLNLHTTVCVANRAPIEIAQSLHKRDGFPLGFGLRLYSSYRKLIALHAPSDSLYVSYDLLLTDPVHLMETLARRLPLVPREEALTGAVRGDLKHQVGEGVGLLAQADTGAVDFPALDAEIERLYPQQRVTADLVQALVARGVELSEKGIEFEGSLSELSSQHIQALATIDERDGQIESLDVRLAQAGGHLSDALAIIPQRDEQILEVQNKLEKLGEEHSYALKIIEERDQQLKEQEEERERFFGIPVVGRLFRKFWSYANS